ncbi:MAG: hypothetical protein ACQERR_04725 [Pseudomonadota bacterium]
MADLSGKQAHIYTTADSVLDGDRTETAVENVGETITGRPFRKVVVPQEYLDGQIKGYQANMETAYTETDWQLEKQFGNVVPSE